MERTDALQRLMAHHPAGQRTWGRVKQLFQKNNKCLIMSMWQILCARERMCLHESESGTVCVRVSVSVVRLCIAAPVL